MVSQNIGVFQGNPLSPILFNIVLNLILEPLSDKNVVKDHGITLSGSTRITNCAFADDANLIARSVSSAQELLNIFEKALSWTRCLKGAPSKFACIGYGKCNETKEFSQYDPKLTYQGVLIPFLGADKTTFRVLGKQFSVGLDVTVVREYVRDKVFEILDKIDKDIIAPHLKLDILEKCISYLRWNFMVHPMPPSWQVQ